MILLTVFYGVFLLGIGFLGFSMLSSLRAEAPYVPTGRRDLKKILEAAEIKPGEVFYDLGSGDGRAVRAAARLGARAVGFEQSWLLVWWSRLWWRTATTRQCGFGRNARVLFRPSACRRSQSFLTTPPSVGSASFLKKNYLRENLSDADVIFCYLMPKAMEHLKEKFETELKPGTRIFSRAFKIPGWTPQARLQFSRRAPPVYVYVKE